MAKVVDEAELVMIPLPLMDKWMTQHNSWSTNLIPKSIWRSTLEVVDSIAFRAMDERLEFW
jgi:CRP/FNR family transcriptional regulator